jgi:hypothetical protein
LSAGGVIPCIWKLFLGTPLLINKRIGSLYNPFKTEEKILGDSEEIPERNRMGKHVKPGY